MNTNDNLGENYFDDKTIIKDMLISKNTFGRYIKKMPFFLEEILADSPDFIVPVEKKGCKLLRSSKFAGEEIKEKVRYLQYFQNSDISLDGMKVAVIDDATKYTSMLYKYREYFEDRGAIVSTYSFVGQELLKTAEREQFDSDARIFQYLEESTYQEYIIQQSQVLSADESFFDIDHFVISVSILPEKYENFISIINSIGDIELINDVYAPANVEKLSLYNFNLASAESMFPAGINKGILQKIRFAYNKETNKLTLAPISFPVWDSVVTGKEQLFTNVPFPLPFEENDSITLEGLFFNICYAFHLCLLKSFLSYLVDFSEFQLFSIEAQDLIAYVGKNRATSVMVAAKEFLISDGSLYNAPNRVPLDIPQKGNSTFNSIFEIMFELRYKYEELVYQSKSLLDVRYFLSYEEVFQRYQGRANLMKWIDILCDRGVLVARNCESNGLFFRACRSGEGDYDHIEKKSYALIPVAINSCGRLEKSDKGEFFRINSMYLNKIFANLAYDYPSEDYDFHALFTKPHHFGPLTYLKDQLEDERDIPIYDMDRISKFCTYDDLKKEFIAPSLRMIRKGTPEYFGQGNAVPYTEITSYLGYLKHVRNLVGKDDFLNAMAICRDEDIYYRHIKHNLLTSYRNIINSMQSIVENRKEMFLRDSAVNINSAIRKLKYEQAHVINILNNSITDEIVFDKAQERIVNSIIPFSEEFIINKKPAMALVACLEQLLTNLMLFDTLHEIKFLHKFLKAYNKQEYVQIESVRYFSDIVDEDRSKWDDETYLDCKQEIDNSVMILFDHLQAKIKTLPSINDRDYLQKKKRQNSIYAINVAARYLSNNFLNEITILHYTFTGYRNLENKKSIDVTATVQEKVADILARERNAKIIFGATGSDEYGTIVFESVDSALDFTKELTTIFSSEGNPGKIISQVTFRLGCACRSIQQENINEGIREVLYDAQRCATIGPKASIYSRLLVSAETMEYLSSPEDFSEIDLADQKFFEYKNIENDEEKVINYPTKEYHDTTVNIGIITALLDEHTAMKQMMTNLRTISFPGRGAGHQFQLGEIKAFGGGEHTVVLAKTIGDGNNKASVRAEKIVSHFPELDVILMVGIAGGTPLVEETFTPNDLDTIEKHVRLGDIVVSDSIIQYDYKKEKFDAINHDIEEEFKGDNIPPSAIFMQAKNTLDENLIEGKKPWIKYIYEAQQNLSDSYKRPDSSTDLLYDYDGKIIDHPVDDNRLYEPYVFEGKIASSNTLLRNPMKRDLLKRDHNVFAIEMESSGIADTTWESGITYYVIRGISDYCDSHKNNVWHKYSALAAAAYARSLIEKVRKQTNI